MTTPEPLPTPSLCASACSAASSPVSADGTAGPAPAEAIHDFRGKLQQPALWPRVVDYVRWQRARRAAAARGEPDVAPPDFAPLSINLDLTTACNYACDHCIDWEILNQQARHDDAVLRESLARMAERGLRSVIVIGGGEPTLYPGFAAMIRFMKELDLQVAVVSNGSRNDRVLQAAPCFTAGDWVRLSLDAGSNATFRRMHHPASRTLTLDEICSWIPKIRAVNPSLTIGYSFVITWRGGMRGDVAVTENIDEMELAAARAAAAGFDYISFKPFLERKQNGAEVMDPHRSADLAAVVARIEHALAAARAAAPVGFRVLASTNLRVLMAGAWRELGAQPRVCHMQALRQVVAPIGTFNCPAHRGVAKAELGAAGLWRDPAAGQAATARMLDGFDAGEECAAVTCLYHGTNWWLEELVDAAAELPAAPPGDEAGDWFL